MLTRISKVTNVQIVGWGIILFFCSDKSYLIFLNIIMYGYPIIVSDIKTIYIIYLCNQICEFICNFEDYVNSTKKKKF